MVIDDAHMSLFGQGAAAVHTKNVLNTIRNKHHPDLVTSIISNERLGTFTQYLKSATHVSMQISDTRAMLSLSYMPITGQRAATIRRTVLECCQNQKVVIFVSRIKDGESLAGLLSDAGLSAQVTHSMKEMNERLSIIQQFNEGRCRILITYRIGLSGISLHWVKSVILDRPPERWEDFLAAVHKAGLIAAGKAYVILNCTDHAEVERFQAIMTNFYHIERGELSNPADIPLDPMFRRPKSLFEAFHGLRHVTRSWKCFLLNTDHSELSSQQILLVKHLSH
jgi:superfamily II DNA/RNA helicase